MLIMMMNLPMTMMMILSMFMLMLLPLMVIFVLIVKFALLIFSAKILLLQGVGVGKGGLKRLKRIVKGQQSCINNLLDDWQSSDEDDGAGGEGNHEGLERQNAVGKVTKDKEVVKRKVTKDKEVVKRKVVKEKVGKEKMAKQKVTKDKEVVKNKAGKQREAKDINNKLKALKGRSKGGAKEYARELQALKHLSRVIRKVPGFSISREAIKRVLR